MVGSVPDHAGEMEKVTMSSQSLQVTLLSWNQSPPFRGIQFSEIPKSLSSSSQLVVFLRRSQFRLHSAGGSQSKPTSESNVSTAASLRLLTASEVVRDFYDGINRRDLESVESLIGLECIYEDLIFSKPFVGRKATLEFFKKFTEYISSDLQFVIDDISSEDTSSVGVTWHLEWRGRPFPFSKGCSFYRLEVLEGTRKIIYARDCVEPALKPGSAALAIISAVTWLLQLFPQFADKL